MYNKLCKLKYTQFPNKLIFAIFYFCKKSKIMERRFGQNYLLYICIYTYFNNVLA